MKEADAAALREFEAAVGRQVTTEPLGPNPADPIALAKAELRLARLSLQTLDLQDGFFAAIPFENRAARRKVSAAFQDLLEILREDV